MPMSIINFSLLPQINNFSFDIKVGFMKVHILIES